MRAGLERWMTEVPAEAAQSTAIRVGSAAAGFLSDSLPRFVKEAIPGDGRNTIIKASAGEGNWAHVTWLAIMRPEITESTRDGYYVVYLLSKGGDRLYLSLCQGCTELKDTLKVRRGRIELRRRAAIMRSKLSGVSKRARSDEIDLNSKNWLPDLYSAGNILSICYHKGKLPSEQRLNQDLAIMLAAYDQLIQKCGWAQDEDILDEAKGDEVSGLDGAGSDRMKQAIRYKRHRSIERRSTHSKKVKEVQGTVCRACKKDMSDVYGEIATGFIHAHHLRPLSDYDQGEEPSLDPLEDFAVLCPNCHAIVHKMDDVSNIDGLRQLIASNS